MLFVKLALWTCAFYLGFWLAAELAFLAVVRWKGSGGVIFKAAVTVTARRIQQLLFQFAGGKRAMARSGFD